MSVFSLLIPPLVEASPFAIPLCTAFAAPSGEGFAGGGFSKQSKEKTNKKRKNGGLLSEIFEPGSTTTTTTNHEDNAEPKIDRWGLPIPTEEDLFPPMPGGTELIPICEGMQEASLSDIRSAMKYHIGLRGLEERFDEHGVEKNPPLGGKPMKLRLLHLSPPVLTIDNFFTEEECQQVKNVVLAPEKVEASNQESPVEVRSATFSALAQSKRTSTSWFCYYSQVPTLLAKAHHVLGIPALQRMEEPQIVRYKTGEEFSWHYDEVPSHQLKNGGQRIATLLVYLNDVTNGGGTVFRDLIDGANGEMLTMKPKLGSALLFFPAFKDGQPDDRTLHKGEPAADEKWIIQMWIHERDYHPTLPDGNCQKLAQAAVDHISQELGYI